MGTGHEKNLGPVTGPLEDTDRIRKAIEKAVDEDTATIPPLPPGLPAGGGIAQGNGNGESPAYDTLTGLPELGTAGGTPTSPQKKDWTETPVHTWFFTFMCMNIPIAGWIYLGFLAFRKKETERRNFARAYLFYKLLFLLISAVILGIFAYIGLGLLDQLLTYMDML